MARPNKQGLDYFPLDVDFFNDEKIEAISGEFGIKGEITTIKLLCAIYRNGYFIVWSDLLKMKLLKNLNGVSKELLEQIVSRLVKWNFFDENLFNSDNVLTSKGIQTRYLEATKRRKKTEILHYCLLKDVNVNINPSIDGVNVNINTQSKVKESKEEEKDKKENPTSSPSSFELGSLFSVDVLERELLNNEKITNAMLKNPKNKFNDLEHLKTRLSDFVKELKGKGTLTKQGNDFCVHFRNWHLRNVKEANSVDEKLKTKAEILAELNKNAKKITRYV